MKNQQNSINSVLKSFSKSDFKRFERFLRSPYFTEGRNLRSGILYSYFRILEGGYLNGKTGGSNKEEVFKKLYPGKKYDSVLMRRLDSDLYRLALEFLTEEEFRNDKADYDISTLGALSKKNWINLS